MSKKIINTVLLLVFIFKLLIPSMVFAITDVEISEKEEILIDKLTPNEKLQQNMEEKEVSIEELETNGEDIENKVQNEQNEQLEPKDDNQEENIINPETMISKEESNNLCKTLSKVPNGIENMEFEYYIGEKSNHERKENKFSGVTEEMCEADYWKDKTIIDYSKQLMDYSEIEELNQAIINGSGTKVFDLEKDIKETFNADERKEILVQGGIPDGTWYINGVEIDKETYFNTLIDAIMNTGYTGEQHIKYGVCTNRADLKDWPTDDFIGDQEVEFDDEMQSSAMNVNEPFVIRAKCEVNGNTYYWGNSNNCTGWTNAKNIAIFENKEEWTNYWKIKTNENNFVVVTGSRINLKKQNSEDIPIMLGTILKLVPENEIPEQLKNEVDSNYIVYFAGNDENGKAKKQYGLLNKNLELNQGFLKLTQENVLNVAFSCRGDTYGWGGMNGNMDCSMYTRQIYRCFGLELPRNTSWQQKTPIKYVDVSEMDDEEKAKYISTLPAGSLFYFSGHTMVYIGMDSNKNFVISDLGKACDEEGEEAEYVRAVNINSLNVKRASGATWLHDIIGIINFADKIDVSECEVVIENLDNIYYDGQEQKPNVILKYNGHEIYQGINYNVEYYNNQEVGNASIEVTGINNFAGTKKETFEIAKKEEISEKEIKEETFETETKEDNKNIVVAQEQQVTNNPQTGDNIILFIIIFIISSVGLIITTKLRNNLKLKEFLKK